MRLRGGLALKGTSLQWAVLPVAMATEIKLGELDRKYLELGRELEETRARIEGAPGEAETRG
jgi:hypothetical protein